MKKNNKTVAMIFAILVVSTGALVFASDDSDAASYGVNVFTPDGVRHTGTGSDLRGAVTSVTGGDLVIDAAGTIISYKGQTAPDGKSWVLFKWVPMSDWVAVIFNSGGNATLENGTSYAIHLSDKTTVGGKTEYSQPGFKPTATAYFFIKFTEQYDTPYTSNLLTEKQRRDGFWISGEGSDAADAFYSACQTYRFELNMNMGNGANGNPSNMKGWLGSFMKMGDQALPNGLWTYWSQFKWDGSGWIFNQSALGFFDPGVTPYFAIVRQTTTEDNATSGLTFNPTAITINPLSPGSVWDGEPGGNGSGQGTDIKPTGITLDNYSLSFFENGSSQKLTATITPSDATNKKAAWSSSNTSVATVDQNGNVKPVGSGNAVITATADGDSTKTAICSVSVKKQSSSGQLELASPSVSVEIGKSVQLTANKAVTSWSSSDPSVAKIDSVGKVTGIKTGTVTITAGSSSGSATCIVTVRAAGSLPDPVPVFGSDTESLVIISDLPSVVKTGSDITLMTSQGRIEMPGSVLSGMDGDDLRLEMAAVGHGSLNDAQKGNVREGDVVVDIRAESSGSGIDRLGGAVTVYLNYAIPRDASVRDLSVWYLKDDGTKESVDFTYSHSDKFIAFETEHFSLFGISTEAPSDGGGSSMAVLIAVLVCALAAAAAGVFLWRRKSSANVR
ncbi:MAG: Ig-like domain-containing protein [Candidatus Methanoplasma sp.]|jgi:hypothetical protein|nr:Ig-like domain-containing protein [Candidatus Methanoplasma sp.]